LSIVQLGPVQISMPLVDIDREMQRYYYQLLILTNLGLISSVCDLKGENPTVNPSLITRAATATPSGYKIDWKVFISPKSAVGCFDVVTIHYNGKPNTKCCAGYQEMIKKPRKTGDDRPFVVSLCGKGYTAIFITLEVWGQKWTSPKIRLNALNACPSSGDSLGECMGKTGLLIGSIIVLLVAS
jgi:hypothetical protein